VLVAGLGVGRKSTRDIPQIAVKRTALPDWSAGENKLTPFGAIDNLKRRHVGRAELRHQERGHTRLLVHEFLGSHLRAQVLALIIVDLVSEQAPARLRTQTAKTHQRADQGEIVLRGVVPLRRHNAA